jgi:hypothetical protein
MTICLLPPLYQGGVRGGFCDESIPHLLPPLGKGRKSNPLRLVPDDSKNLI